MKRGKENMNLLMNGTNEGLVRDTGRVTKLAIGGISSNYKIYQVRLDCLYYNDQNDRIATWISQYKEENRADGFDKSNLEEYNNVIQKFIEESNPDRMHTTQSNIEMIGQQNSGVILSDGRIIDGNRRFSCLRNLSKKDAKFNWFETVILNENYENNAKQIKMLELQIQIGTDTRVDYNPIDKLVGLYRDIEENKLLTVEEYARSTNTKVAEVNKQLAISKLMVEYLESINAAGKYYLAREMNLNGPLVELYGCLNKIKDENTREDMKLIAFTNITAEPDGDITRFVRKFKDIVGTKYEKEFVEKEMPVVEKVIDSLSKEEKVTSDTIANIRQDENVKEELVNTMEVVHHKVKATDAINKPVENLKKTIGLLEEIDDYIIRKQTDEQKENTKEYISRIEELLANLKEALNV